MNERFAELISLAEQEFGELTPAEEMLVKTSTGPGIALRYDEPCLDKWEEWPDESVVRADLIRWLVADSSAREFIDASGIGIEFVRIEGNLSLDELDIPFPIQLTMCIIPGEIHLQRARCRDLHFLGSRVGKILAYAISINGDLNLNSGFQCMGGAWFNCAEITGSVRCSEGMYGSCSVNDQAGVEKEDIPTALAFMGANLGKDLDLTSAEVNGALRLTNATIQGRLLCTKAIINSLGRGDVALDGVGVRVGGNLVLNEGFLSIGAVRLIGASVKGDLILAGGTFIKLREDAVIADRIKVNGIVSLDDIAFAGWFGLNGARISGDLLCTGTQFLTDNVTANLAISTRTAFDIELEGDSESDNTWYSRLDCEYLEVARRFRWKNVKLTERSELNLFHAKVGRLVDEPTSWPSRGSLMLDGFIYDSIASGPLAAEERLEWIERASWQVGEGAKESQNLVPRFTAQPYEQLAKIFRATGLNEQATKVAIAKRERRRLYGDLSWWERMSSFLLKYLSGYGYRPHRALVWMGIFILLGVPVFESAYISGALVSTPAGKEIGFNAWIYSLDVFVPVIDFSQASNWTPSVMKGEAISEWWKTGYVLYYWFHIAIGWFLSSVAVVAVTGIARKD